MGSDLPSASSISTGRAAASWISRNNSRRRLGIGQLQAALTSASVWFCQTLVGNEWNESHEPTPVGAGEDVAFGSDDVEDHEFAVVAAQPWQQAGPQERRLSRTRCAEDDKQCFRPRRTRIRRSASRPRISSASRPKNTPASTSSCGSHPR